MAVFFGRYQDAMNFRPERFNPIPLAGNSRVKVILACFEAGQFIPVHRPGVDLTLIILQGEGVLIAGEREERIGAGAIAFIPAGEERGLKAESRVVALHVVSPPPTDADHVEVMSKLQQGIWK
ncbi:MAG: cupin domain-containing protein, partial [Deltaproteobacteria bacterium]|nr:cupin domain-containing protein [Deltaproteobacteria bacterium]